MSEPERTRAETLAACWDAIDAKIVRGPLRGKGTDDVAERNGLIQAANIIARMIREKHHSPEETQ
jgi:hypothetical protein